MRQTYADYLKANGASDEDIKAMDTPVARRAYDAMMDKIDTAEAARLKLETDVKNYDKWFNEEATPSYERMQHELVIAKANEARAASALRTLHERGIVDVAKDLGYDLGDNNQGNNNAGNNNAAGNRPTNRANGGGSDAIDTSKYVTTDVLMSVADREGDAIAAAQDIAREHVYLFPDKPLSFRELRKEAVQRKLSVEQVWMDKYGVPTAREAKAKADKEAYEKKLREEGAKSERERLVSQYGNPDTRPLSPSANPFAIRKEGDRAKQPWDTGNDLSADRVTRATRTVMEKVQ